MLEVTNEELIRSTALAVEIRLTKTLMPFIEKAVKPLHDAEKILLQNQIDDLDFQLKEMSNALTEISNTFLGLWVIKKAKRKMYKEQQKRLKGEQKDVGKKS